MILDTGLWYGAMVALVLANGIATLFGLVVLGLNIKLYTEFYKERVKGK